MKSIEQNVPVVLFILQFTVVLTFEWVNETLECGNPDESQRLIIYYCAVLLYKVLCQRKRNLHVVQGALSKKKKSTFCPREHSERKASETP